MSITERYFEELGRLGRAEDDLRGLIFQLEDVERELRKPVGEPSLLKERHFPTIDQINEVIGRREEAWEIANRAWAALPSQYRECIARPVTNRP